MRAFINTLPRTSILSGLIVSIAIYMAAVRSHAENNYAQSFTDGATYNLPGELIVGTNGINNTLLISNGSDVTNTIGTIGQAVTANSNHGTVTGTGSVWRNTDAGATAYSFYLGRNGSSNTLVISAGGKMHNAANAIIGEATTAIGNSATVTDSGSVWSNTNIRVGGDVGGGSSNRLTIINGGRLASNLDIGYAGPSRGNVVVVDGVGSVIESSPNIGFSGDDNQLIVQNGGRLQSVNLSVGSGSGSSGNQLLITGAGSSWTNLSGALILGVSGFNNSLIVSNGGTAFIEASSGGFNYIGINNTASNNYARVVGANSTLISTFALHVGQDGSSNALFIADGGRVEMRNLNASVNYGLVIGANSASANNLLQIDGGTLISSNNLSSSAPIDVRRGALVFNSGTIVTEQLLATTGASSVINFNGGLLVSSNTVVSNGSAFTIGNGGGVTAEFRPRGGTHTFANGVTIASDGVLSGTGTVVGAVIQAGTIAPGFSPGQLNITGNLTQQLSSVLSLEIGGTTQGITYDFLNITGAGNLDGRLDVALFNAFTPSFANTFTVVTASAGLDGVFTNAPGSGRYSFNSGYWDVTYTANSVLLSNFVVPEPSTLLLLATGSVLVWRRGRRRTGNP